MKFNSPVLFFFCLLMIMASLSSCVEHEEVLPCKGEAMFPVSLDMRVIDPSFATRTDIPDDMGERIVNSFDVIVFSAGDNSVFSVYSESDPVQTGEDGSFASGAFLVPSGNIDLYVVANGPESVRNAGTRSALLDAVSLFADNSPESFVMTASKSVDVSSLTPDGDGVRHVSGVSLERIASKVVLGKVAKAFASPALNSVEVRLLGARLVNVPKSSKVMRPSSGDAVPGAAATAYHNGTAGWEDNSLITWSPASSLEVTTSGVETGASLYGYPNTTTEAAQAADGDRVMKLVLKVSVDGTVYYYPIGIPQMTDASRNLIYRINKVTLRRPGNTDDDPTKYLDNGAVDVMMSVLDWNEAAIVSDYAGDLLSGDDFREWTDEVGYHLENLTTDGTAATAFDTGLKLFDGVSYPNGFRLEADFSFPNGGTELAGQHSYISDKAEEMSGWPGFTLRHTYAAGSKMELTFKPVFSQNPVTSILPENHVVIEYDGQTANVTINGHEYTGTGAVPVHDYPLTLGGTYNPVGTWIEDRFADVMIVSLTVSPLGDGGVFREWTDDEGYHLVNLTCDGTSSTAYNTGLKLFDSASYPNGFRLSADFTVDSSEISKNSRNTYLTCMSEAASPWPGFVVRHAQQASATGEIDVNTTANLNAVTPALLSGSNHLEITYDGSVTTVRFNGATVNTLNGAVTAHSYPLVLGGSLDGTYNSSTTYSSMSALPWRRFSKVTFSSLLVEALDAVVNDL